MDDMISRLSEILDNPEQTEKIKKIAASMMGRTDEQPSTHEVNELPQGTDEQQESVQVSAAPSSSSRSYERLFTTMNCSKNVTLLNAIRPYMRSSRAEKIGSAIKAMEMIELLSKLK